jgi:hypothetical protein
VLGLLYHGANDRGMVTRGIRRLAKDSGLGLGSVQRAVQQLVVTELISVVRQDDRFGTTYRVVDSVFPVLKNG